MFLVIYSFELFVDNLTTRFQLHTLCIVERWDEILLGIGKRVQVFVAFLQGLTKITKTLSRDWGFRAGIQTLDHLNIGS
jgi:hypothetical protein